MDNLTVNNITDTSSVITYIDIALSQKICLILFSALLIPSVLLAFYVFYWMYHMAEVRNRLNNHLIIGIFVVSFIQTVCEMPLLLRYLNTGHVAFDSFYFCKFWIAFNYSLNTLILFLNSYLSVERYLLIFHRHFLNRYKIWVHFLPMVILTAAAVVYSCATPLFYPCEEQFSYESQLCGGPCYELQPGIGTFDVIFTVFIPLTCIIVFNCVLIIRVIQQKRRMAQKNVWKKNFGMLVQLLSVSILHTVVWMPVITVIIIALASNPPSDLIIQLQSSWVFINIVYFAVLGNPVICIFAIPEIREKVIILKKRIQQRFFGYPINQIHPSIANTIQTNRLQTH